MPGKVQGIVVVCGGLGVEEVEGVRCKRRKQLEQSSGPHNSAAGLG